MVESLYEEKTTLMTGRNRNRTKTGATVDVRVEPLEDVSNRSTVFVHRGSAIADSASDSG